MKTIRRLLKRFFIPSILLLPLLCYSQKGSIKIFSETKGFVVYLDDELRGTDILKMDSVIPGSHYLKIMKDSSFLYSELISVKANEVTTILVKKKPEQLLKKQDDFKVLTELYQTKCLEVLIDMKYAEDNTQPYNKEFGDYFSYNGSFEIDTASMKNTVDDWFILQGGSNEISDYDFANLINKPNIAGEIEQNKINRRARKILGWTSFGIGTGIMIAGFMILQAPISQNFTVEKQIRNGEIVFGVGFVPMAAGLYAACLRTPRSFTLSEAVKQVDKYNKDLKKQLGLPENFELKK